MVKAIIFDCFDVLVTNGLPGLLSKYLAQDSKAQNAILALEESLNAGRINYETFLLKIAEFCDIPVEKTRRQLENNQPDEQLFRYISQELKPHYKLGLLSSAGADWLEEMIGPHRRALFDAVVLSYQAGAGKPHPQAYRRIAARLSVEPAQCIMIDDKEYYCEGARKAGMQALRYRSAGQLQQELNALLRQEQI